MNIHQEALKKMAAKAALEYVRSESIIGVGTGSTVNYFIKELSQIKHTIEAAVASSESTRHQLKAAQIPVYDLNAVDQVPVYVDGADEANIHGYLIKGGGAAHTREKILATVAKKFVCIVDQSKRVDVLGKLFPVPIEVIPMARSYVAREIVNLGGDPVYREGVITDNGNIILDAYHLNLLNPPAMEQILKNITGVVDHGIFAKRHADVLLVATHNGMETLTVE